MDGVNLRPDAWTPLFESEEDWILVAPILAHCHDEEGKSLVGAEGDKLAVVLEEATGMIPATVVAIDRYWKARRSGPAKNPKVGRNDPCPCGSGRKFKQCCGAA